MLVNNIKTIEIQERLRKQYILPLSVVKKLISDSSAQSSLTKFLKNTSKIN